MSMRAIVDFVVEDSGQDLVEYALLSGIIGMAGMLVLPSIRAKMAAAYSSWLTNAQTAWEPCPPAPAVCP